MRLNLYISKSGHCSRRKADLLIKEGKVRVNDRVVTEPWFNVEDGSSVKAGDALLSGEARICLLFNKPKGVTTTLSDKFAEKKITDCLPKSLGRIYPVGRLDKLSRGLIILTNDGDLCYHISHPKFEIEKEYMLLVKGRLDDSIHRKLKDGVRSGEDILKVKDAQIEKTGQDEFSVRVIVCEGKKRHLRRLFESLGLKVLDLKRTRIGPFRLGDLKEGSYRIIDAGKELERFNK
ncbi:MAG: pseudouridine synthase [Candidatus Omnitrophica bacterium]|nr:pseudouridine synthase [Candidatus Omnitrophota bacterium]